MAGPGGSTTRTKKQQRAYDVVKNARRDGDMKMPHTCQRCGKSGHMETHHSDYSKPRSVSYLCSSCNRKSGTGRNA